MKRHASLLLILVFLSGCVSARMKPPVDTSGKVRKIVVVPMEAPPLEVFLPSFTNNLPVAASATMTWVPDRAIHTAGKVGVMVFGIFMLLDMPETARRSAKIAESLDNVLDSKDAWIPTIVLSEEAVGQIARQGTQTAILERKFRKYPGITNRERTFFGENWMAPMRNWYNQEQSPYDYKAHADQGADAILEVGLLNYSLYRDSLIVQVMVKLVDPSSGKVLGRARDFDLAKLSKTDNLFEDDAQCFKELFAETARKPMIENLRYLGLLAAPTR
jgi:hypothetical protein